MCGAGLRGAAFGRHMVIFIAFKGIWKVEDGNSKVYALICRFVVLGVLRSLP